jgi:hypothetical protein
VEPDARTPHRAADRFLVAHRTPPSLSAIEHQAGTGKARPGNCKGRAR